MSDHGSDTETDDELAQRGLVVSRTPRSAGSNGSPIGASATASQIKNNDPAPHAATAPVPVGSTSPASSQRCDDGAIKHEEESSPPEPTAFNSEGGQTAAPSAHEEEAVAPSVEPLEDGKVQCLLCKQVVEVIPPVGMGRMQCNCCLLVLSTAAFSNNQRRPDHPSRRCMFCVKTKALPAKFRGMHPKIKPVDPTDPNDPRLTQRQRARLGVVAAAAPRAAPGASPVSTQATSAERAEMEAAVRSFKLAKRSIERRRKANDLRGSTRLEYEMQLQQEEIKVDRAMVQARSKNPALFDELLEATKVKSARVPPEERDNAGKQKKNKKVQQTKQKSPKAKKAVSPKPAKRKANEAGAPDAKRSKPEPAVSAGDDKKAVFAEATAPVASGTAGIASGLSTAGPVTTRARTRRATQAPVVIDLVDSDSE